MGKRGRSDEGSPNRGEHVAADDGRRDPAADDGLGLPTGAAEDGQAQDEAERLLAELEEERQRKQRKSDLKQLRFAATAAHSEAARDLLEGPPGTEARRRVPLRQLTSQRKIAWQWCSEGKIQYMIPIGSGTPFSPFTD
eukprot:CAMPEP_0204564134 /NCGR_PEP_ID=MMETSP0661-20131031/34711_1 /ASSEMBLY_ACC=CAM_ASM_000606 /TAXON_ID=109239 /ORGANISM="Alexandrium margalefi, Strain AMGDE01CS-322" /LENGTH=138 /DNA_ID=CAMNT_0051571755 /DNA_START=18 /DNA_END=434 /DNA_ORIENTATION=+